MTSARLGYAAALTLSCKAAPDFANTIEFVLPSLANMREFVFAKARRIKSQRMAGRVLAHGFPAVLPGEKWIFVLTRIAPKQLDSDNVASAFKAIRDGIADRAKINDGETRIIWHYEQEKSKTPKLKLEAWRLAGE